jgi:hypothetical protein
MRWCKCEKSPLEHGYVCYRVFPIQIQNLEAFEIWVGHVFVLVGVVDFSLPAQSQACYTTGDKLWQRAMHTNLNMTCASWHNFIDNDEVTLVILMAPVLSLYSKSTPPTRSSGSPFRVEPCMLKSNGGATKNCKQNCGRHKINWLDARLKTTPKTQRAHETMKHGTYIHKLHVTHHFSQKPT